MKSAYYYIILFIAFQFTAKNLFAQITFQEPIGGSNVEIAKCVRQTKDGGYILAGSTTSYGFGNSDAYLVKTDSMGIIQWTRTFGGANSDVANSVAQTPDSGYVVVGTLNINVIGSGGDIFVIRTDPNGDTLWTKVFAGSHNFSRDGGFSVQITSDSGYIVSGFHERNDICAALIRIDKTGNVLWSKSYGPNKSANSVIQTFDGGFVFTGFTYSITLPHLYNEIYLAKVNALGNIIWNKRFKAADCYSQGFSVKQTLDSGFIIAGYGEDQQGVTWSHGFLLKTNSNGNLQWLRKIVASIGFSRAFEVCQTADSCYELTGFLGTSAFLTKTNSSGIPLWSKFYSYCNEEGGGMGLTKDNGFILANSATHAVLGSGYAQDIIIIKCDSMGNSGCLEFPFGLTMPNIYTSDSVTQTTLHQGISLINSLINVDSGGIITMDCFAVGISEYSNNNLNVMIPNPINESNIWIKYQIPNNNTGILKIYNTMGKVVFNCKLPDQSNECQIQLPLLADGIYVFNIISGNQSFTKKIFIQIK